jgi:hypothetical protein
MNFFILGDSWGVGEWKYVNHKFISIPCTGLDFYLTQLGHTVTNISAGSAGNFGQLRHAYWTLKENANYDFMIWFHTESMRDIKEIMIDDPDEGRRMFPNFAMDIDFDQVLHYINVENYRYAQNLYKEYQVPFIVIGGQSPVDPVIKEFEFAQHVITSWLQELLELDVIPPANTFFSWDKIKHILDHYKIDEKSFVLQNFDSLTRADKIVNLARKSCLFPDNGHPSRTCFEQLANRILDLTDQNHY